MEDTQKYQLRYLILPESIYKDDSLTSVALKVYGFIHTYINPFFFGNEHLAKMFKCSEQRISDAIKQLIDLKYISTFYKPNITGGTTRLVMDNYSDKSLVTSRLSKKRAPTSHGRLAKDSNDNNIKYIEKFLPEDLIPNYREKLEARRVRKKDKVPFTSGYSKFSTRFEKPAPRGVRHREDVF